MAESGPGRKALAPEDKRLRFNLFLHPGTVEVLEKFSQHPEESIGRAIDRFVAANGHSQELQDYQTLLKLSLPAFSVPEASLLCDALNGIITEPHSARLLWANIQDALRDGLAEKWQVDGDALVARLQTLTPFEAWAVAQAVKTWWDLPAEQRDSDMAASLHAVGLVRGQR